MGLGLGEDAAFVADAKLCKGHLRNKHSIFGAQIGNLDGGHANLPWKVVGTQSRFFALISFKDRTQNVCLKSPLSSLIRVGANAILNANDDDAVRVRPGAAREHADLRAEPVRGVPAAAVRRRAPLRLRPRRAELGPRLVRLLHATHDPGGYVHP